MICARVSLPGGGVAIVCGGSRARKCKCGRPATLLCDWKDPAHRSGTCDKPICAACALSPAPGKDICQAHAGACRAWLNAARDAGRKART